MIKKRTTLVLGAGASHHLGYPLGAGLRDALLQLMMAADRHSGDLNKLTPLLGDVSLWTPFAENLSRGGWKSPDAFLERHQEYISMGKVLMAFALKQLEVDHRLFPPHNNGWYGYLGDCLLADAESVDEFGKNRLSIVTYNYDRSIECFLHNLVKHRYLLADDVAWEVVASTVRIVHVHGILGVYPGIRYSQLPSLLKADQEPLDLLKEIAGSIKIVHEFGDADDNFCSPEFKTANELLGQAEVIYCLGFGFAPANVRRLRFFEPQVFKEKIIRCAVGPVHGRQWKSLCESIATFGFPRTGGEILSQNVQVFFDQSYALE